jgi:hypothetical protein
LGERFAEPLDRSIQKINKKQQNREICINWKFVKNNQNFLFKIAFSRFLSVPAKSSFPPHTKLNASISPNNFHSIKTRLKNSKSKACWNRIDKHIKTFNIIYLINLNINCIERMLISFPLFLLAVKSFFKFIDRK